VLQPAIRSVPIKIGKSFPNAHHLDACVMLRFRIIDQCLRSCMRAPARCASSTSGPSNLDFDHCLDLLKQNDLERSYLQLAFVPSEFRFGPDMPTASESPNRTCRASFVALRSLNAELALIADKSAESSVLKMCALVLRPP
jgi:hypothetical protein